MSSPKHDPFPDFRIVRSITQAGTLYFLFECSTKSEEVIGPAHEHEHRVAAIREWVTRTIEKEGPTAFDAAAKAFIKKVLRTTPDKVAKAGGRHNKAE